ncbi:MAG: acetylglutamate kinase [Firmicutes bacterium HGW-Firmicutes-9]|jgi:acetylglutamate kinase|nr:MAG: acetylglutamate kinase [Firmicutes bacterium HGW-Firmicutes-9]
MGIDIAKRAEVLIQALPYIQNYYGKTVVVKYGGSAMEDEALKQAVMGDVVLLTLVGVKIVLVHGGGPEISATLKKLGKESVFVGGLRVTDKETVDVAQMVLAGKVNKGLVNLIQNAGGRAIGISGMDGHLIEAKMLDEKLGYVGEIVAIHPEPIKDLLEKGYIPVVSTIGCDKAGNTYNINADTAAAYIAGALQAESLINMTDTKGVLMDAADPDSLIVRLSLAEIPKLQESGVVTGGMIPKLECCAHAVEKGANRAFIIDGRVPHAILIEMLTDEGIGTMVTA